MDYAQAVARVLANRIDQSRTVTAKGTVTAVTTDGFTTFSDAMGNTRKGVWVGVAPVTGDVVTYLDEGRGFPLVLGTTGNRSWTAPTLVGSWTDFGSGYAPAGYRKIGSTVFIRGLITGSGGAIGAPTAIFALPAGYRPPFNLIFPTVSNNAFGRLNVSADGTVDVEVGNTAFVSLNGVEFSID